MKIRNGFVSNSSSSSFVVVLEKKPETPEELKNILFGDKESISYYDYTKTTEEASKRIFNDIENYTKNPYDLVEKIVYGLDEWDVNSIDQFKKPDGNYDWNKYDKAKDQHIENEVVPRANKFIEKYKNKFIFCTTYDDSGSDVVYERGNVFEKAVECLVINEH